MRTAILDKLIDDLEALTYSGGGTMFEEVKKIYFDLPDKYPSALVTNLGTDIKIIGNQNDERSLQFQIGVVERLENSTDETEQITKIDRLMNIEDVLIDYLEKIPNNLEHDTSWHITDIKIDNVIYNYLIDNTGIVLSLSINFTLKVLVDTRLL